MDPFMILAKEMRTAQKEYFRLRKGGASHAAQEALQRSKALESRVDQEIRAAEEAEGVQNGDVIVLKDGRKLVQGNLFDNL